MSNDKSTETNPYVTDFDTFIPKSDELPIVRKIEDICFTGCKKFWYNFFSIIISIPLSAAWGIMCAMIQFMNIWILTPILTIINMIMAPLLNVVTLMVNMTRPLLGTVAIVCDGLFGDIIRRFKSHSNTINNQNENQDEEQPLVEINVSKNTDIKEIPTDGGNFQQELQVVASAPHNAEQ
eukprot:418967_1